MKHSFRKTPISQITMASTIAFASVIALSACVDEVSNEGYELSVAADGDECLIPDDPETECTGGCASPGDEETEEPTTPTTTSVAPISDKKGTKRTPLPAGGQVHQGTRRTAEWLYWHETNSGLWCFGDCLPFWLLDCDLTEAQEQAIADAANRVGGGLGARLANASAAMGAALRAQGGNHVCRHHALCAIDVLNRMGLTPNTEVGPKHAWVSVTAGNRTYHIDPYNGSVFSVPE